MNHKFPLVRHHLINFDNALRRAVTNQRVVIGKPLGKSQTNTKKRRRMRIFPNELHRKTAHEGDDIQQLCLSHLRHHARKNSPADRGECGETCIQLFNANRRLWRQQSAHAKIHSQRYRIWLKLPRYSWSNPPPNPIKG